MKNKKIVMISLILLAIITLGVASATEDVSVDDSTVLDDINVDANGDIPIDNLSTNVDSNIDDNDDAIGNEEIDEEANVLENPKEKLGSSKLYDSEVVTSANFFDYFDANGNLKSSVSGDLTFKDEFSAIVPSITINKGITINSDHAVLRNMAVQITATNVVLNGLTLISDATAGDLIYVGASDATLTNLDITYTVGDEDAIAINIDGADNVEITNSSIFFESSVSSDEKTAIAINVFDALDILIDGNNITTRLPALYVQNYDWEYMLMGLTTVNPVKFKEVIGLVYSNNIQDSSINDCTAGFPTAQSIFIVGCDDINIINNDFSMVDTVTPEGTNVYFYAFTIGFTTDSKIIGNNFNIFTNGGGPEAGTAYAIQVVKADLNISDNIIVSQSNGPNLGIYSASMNGEDSHLYISNNEINITGLATNEPNGWGLVSGIEIQNGVGQIYNNTIYTHTIGDYADDNYLFGVSYEQWMTGQRSFDVRDNIIVTEGKYAVSIKDADSLNVTGNTLIAHDLSGDEAVNPGSCTETDIRDNTDEIPSPDEPITPNIDITANNVWNGYSNDIIVNVTGIQDNKTVNATGNVTIRINGKEETIELVDGIATYTIAAEDIITGENTVTVSYSGSDEFDAGTATASFKTLDGVITNETFFDYFNRAENGRLYNYIPDGVTLDFQGAFYSTPERNFTMNINKPVNIITSTHDAFIDLNTTAGSLFGEDPGDSFAITYGGSGTNVTDIVFHNSQIWVFNAHNVTLDHINNTIEDQRVGSGNGATSIRANSTYVTVKNSYFYTRNNGGSSSLVIAWADYCNFDNNTVVVEGEVGNMIYLTTYNVDIPSGVLPNQYNNITNNKIYGFKQPAAICWGIVVSGANNLIEGNFIDYGGTGINAQWGQGDFINNTYRNNVLINGSAFTAPDGSTVYNNSVAGAMNTGKNSLAYNNTVGKNLTVGIGATAYDNTANGLIVNENATAYDNLINGATQVNGKNAIVEDCILNGAVTLKGDNSKVLNSTITGNVALNGNDTLLQDSAVDGDISFGTKSAGTATVDGNIINGQISNKATNNNLVITNNFVNSTGEYAIVLKSKNNIVEYNQLYSANFSGENAVSFDSSKNNTVQNNYPPYLPDIYIETPTVWVGNSASIVITVVNLEGAETIPASGNITVKINGKEETIELIDGQASYTIPGEYVLAGENTITVTYNGSEDFTTGEKNASFTPLDGVVTKDTFQYYFNEDDNYTLFDYVPEGATLDFQGDFIGAYTTNIDKAVNIVSTTGDAFIETNKTGSFNILNGGSGTNVTGLSFLNTAFYITNASNVVIDDISMIANMSGVGSSTGFLSIRSNSSYVTVKNSYFENGGTGSSCLVIGKSSYCVIDSNIINATKNSGNIIYITTYVGTGDTPCYNNITNNLIESQVNSAFCYAIAVIGGYNLIENNTINHPGAGIVQQSTWGTAPQPNGFNSYINNTLTGGCGLTAMVNSTVKDNDVAGAITLNGDCTAEGNTANSLTINGANCIVRDNTINGAVTVAAAAKGTEITENTITGLVTVNSNDNRISGNDIRTSSEYTVDLKTSSNNTVTENMLIATEKTGDESVKFEEGKDNTVKDNFPPYKPDIQIDVNGGWYGNDITVEITVTNANGPGTILASGNVTIKVNGKEETVELNEGKATYIIPSEDTQLGENTVTVTYNGSDDIGAGEDNATFVLLYGAVTKDTFQYYFDAENNYTLFDYIPEGATLDFQGDFIGAYTTNINKPVNIVSTTGDAFIETNKTGSFNILNGGSGTNVTGLSFLNTAFYITNASNVVIDDISMIANMSGVGSSTGFLSIRSNSSYVTVKNSYFENGGTGSSCLVIGKSSYCVIDSNIINATKNSGNIIYITTYVGTGDTPCYNNITNNVIESQVNSAFCYAIAVIGGYNLIENNTINHPGAGIVQQSTWGTAPQPNGFNSYINNTLTGGCGLTAMVNSTVKDNDVAGAITLNGDCTAEGNTANSLTINGANCILRDNTINGAVTVAAAAKGTEITENTIAGLVTVNSNDNKISGNDIRTTSEYTVDLKTSSNNTVTDNMLIATEKTGDESVKFEEGKDNTVKDNFPPYKPDIEIDVNANWYGNDATVEITVTNANGPGTILATGTVTVKINGKEETIELEEGKATYIIPGEYVLKGENTVTVIYNGAGDIAAGENEATFTPLDGVVTKDTFQYYFDAENNYTLFDYTPEGATLDFQGDFIGAYTTNINKPVNIVSTTGDAFIETNKTGSFNILNGGSGTNVTGLSFLNTAFYITNASNVVIDDISMIANMSGVGSSTGFLSIRSNSSYVTVKNSYFENGGTGSSCLVIGKSSYCVIDSNIINATKNSGNIIYITTYVGTGDTPCYNNITNNLIESQVNSAFCYAIAVIGGYNLIENNTINHPGAGIVQQSTWGTAPQPNGFNSYINNTLTGGCGLTAMVNSTVKDNDVAGAITLNGDCTAEGNTANSLTINGANCIVKDNTINGAVTVAAAAKGTEITENTITGLVTVNSNDNKISGNDIRTTGEYTVDLKTTSNNIVTDNILYAAEKVGDASVNFAEDKNNTVKENYPLSTELTLVVDDAVTGEASNINVKLVDSKGQAVNGTVKITAGDSVYNVEITDGKGSVAIGPFEETGTYDISASFEDEDYAPTTAEASVTVYGPGNVTVKHTDAGDAHDIQAAIDAANPGDIVQLGDYDYTDVADVNITKPVTLAGSEGTTITSAADGTPIFNVPAISQDGPETVDIKGIDFKLNNGDTVVKAIADNDTESNMNIDTPLINITDNVFETANDNVVPESITILELDSERGILSPTREISISDNTIAAGIDPFDFEVTTVTSGDETIIGPQNLTPERKATVIEYNDMNTTAVSPLDPRTGEWFTWRLVDEDGNPLANTPMKIGFNGVIYDEKNGMVTDENGYAKLQINLGYKGDYTFAISFLGNDDYNASFVVAKIKVATQTGSLTVPNKSYAASAKTKSLTATFKTKSGKVVANKKISFTVNGKTYSAKTNDKGVATVNVSLNKKGTYSFTAKFAGDSTYSEMSKTAKLTIK